MSRDFVPEKVPTFIPRVGDTVIQGSNNSLIVCGRDRAAPGPASPEKGLGSLEGADKGLGTGTIHLVVGRRQSDPDLMEDDAYIYVSRKTDVDGNLTLGEVPSPSRPGPTVAAKADHVRIVARKSVKIVLGKSWIRIDDSGVMTLEGEVRLGEGAEESILKGDTFSRIYLRHKHPSPVGVTGAPIPDPDVQQGNHLSRKNKVR